MKLVIAEKPVLARDIARAICGKRVTESTRLPISGNGYTVAACAGHLLELVEPDAIDAKWGKPWNLEALPVEVDDWPKEPAKGKKELVDRIASLLREAECVIHAGDPDDEGQLIVDELLSYLGYSGKVWRVYINDSIEKNILRAFENLVPNEQCVGAGKAAYARQMADMCFGVNESRLATSRLGAFLTVGRVQTPTLGLVVARDEAIENHVAQTYFELFADGECADTKGSVSFKLRPGEEILDGEKRLFSRVGLDALKAELDGTDTCFTTETGVRRVSPPLPYNLTVLLSDMSRRFGFTAAKTQRITQDLRDKHKAITYNRSDSQYLKEEHHAQAPQVLAQAMRNLGVFWDLDFTIHSKAFNDKNVTAHHGIIPQEVSAPVGKMTADEARVYTAIVERYAMQFLPPALYDVSTSRFKAKEGTLEAKATRVKELGFKSVFAGARGDSDEEGEEDPSQAKNPWLQAGEHQLHGIVCHVDEKETTPPNPYTEGTLIADMASIAKYVKDPGMKAVLKMKDDGKKGEHGGIGTTATRSAIIENLKSRGYIEETGKGKARRIRSTSKGRDFFHLLPADISGADVTAQWWLIQQDVETGKADVNAVQRSVVDVFTQHLDDAYQGVTLRAAFPSMGKCPKCGAEVIDKGAKSKKYVCSSNKWAKGNDGKWELTGGCGFSMWKYVAGKKLTASQVKELLENGETKKPVRGLKAKSGNIFEAKLRMSSKGAVEFVFGPMRR